MNKIQEMKLRNIIHNIIKEETIDFKKYLKSNNVIDLGYENGWDNNTMKLYKNLKKYATGKEQSKYLNSQGTNVKYQFPIKLKDDKLYTVTYNVDSSD